MFTTGHYPCKYRLVACLLYHHRIAVIVSQVSLGVKCAKHLPHSSEDAGSNPAEFPCSPRARVDFLQHLLHIILLLLQLLPLASSCSSRRSLAELGHDYSPVVETDLNNADFVSTLHNLTCQMKTIKPSLTKQLVSSVLDSIECFCSVKSSEEHKAKSKRTTAMTPNHKQQRKISRETQKLCKVNAILSSMTKCYEILNSLLGDTR
ncbi:uncharacterized protein LOC133396797 isoform X2 [Phycodurus eques]|uniref:uncharacterized protein LOC133396797 isoform X2 n=1 Tax=Phycodurus eques TaxID=693459 RepID=UPI002ACEDE6A|nr:uncharacterized protein LOC133396797 isoform X2 [Phycodurus eques]